MPSRREQKIQQLCARLVLLLNKEQDHQATMQYLQDKMEESGLIASLNQESPATFAADLETALKQENPDNWTFPHQPPLSLRTAEELILSLLK